MSIPMYRLYNEKNNPYKLDLWGGRNGLYKEVSWVYVMENVEYASFLHENALVFTTGMGKTDDDWLKRLVEVLIEANCAGLVLNVGKYLSMRDITPEIAALCDVNQFPLFTIPWNIRLSDITHEFLYTIFTTKQTEYEIVNACKQLIFGQHPREAISKLRVYGFPEKENYRVVALYFEKAYSPDRLESLMTSAKFILNEQSIRYILFPLKRVVLLVMRLEGQEDASYMLRSLYRHLHASEAVQPVIGTSMIISALEKLPVAYRQAICAGAWAHSHHKIHQYFGDLGIYALLFSQNNDMVMKEIHDNALKPLLAYDMTHHRDLFQTLESYIMNNGSVQAVSKETYAHRNTVAYRIQKIEHLLDCDLNNQHIRFTYYLACHIHRYFQLLQDENDIL